MATKNTDPKPGYKTTEFWLSALCALVSLLWGVGILNPEGAGTANQVFGFVASALAALGYTVSRGLAKKQG